MTDQSIRTIMLVNIPEPEAETSIFRIFKLNHFIDLILNKKLTLVQPRKWDDPYENFLYKQIIETDSGPVDLRSAEDRIYGNCWSLNSNTDFGWRVYAPNKDGIEIKTKVSTLRKQLSAVKLPDGSSNLKIGKVEYLEWPQIVNRYQNKNGMGVMEIIANFSLFTKRIEFSAENEVRIIANCSNNNQEMLRIPIDPAELIDCILIDPRLTKIEFETLNQTIRILGYHGPINQSKLYDAPDMQLRFTS